MAGAESADKKASVDGLPTGWGSIDISILTLLSHESICGWFSATGQSSISIRFAIMLYHCIIPGDGAASMREIVLKQRLDQSRNRLRKVGLARSMNA